MLVKTFKPTAKALGLNHLVKSVNLLVDMVICQIIYPVDGIILFPL